MEKICNDCGKKKNLNRFPKNKGCKNGRTGTCKQCAYKKQKKWRDGHKKNVSLSMEKYRAKYPEKIEKYRKEYLQRPKVKARSRVACKKFRDKIRNEILLHYGKKCICCGEQEPLFLTIDHINNDGRKHRKSIGKFGGAEFHYWVWKNNFPNNLQILCWNCNLGKHRNKGICPHKAKENNET